MKIIQSFWTGGINNIFDSSFGWPSPKYNLISWILSANQLLKHYDEVELYTDTLGAKILIDELKIPYKKVHIVLDELNSYNKDFWALAKIKAYELQNSQFIHVDGDVFIWKAFPKRLNFSKLLTQNLEIVTEDYYISFWKEINSNLIYLQPELNVLNNEEYKYACNMGIVGGHDISFFKEYCKKAFNFVNKNKNIWNKINGNNFNVFFEQLLFYELANKKSKKIDFLFKEIPKDNNYVGFGDFHKVPNDKVYLHLLGNYKRHAYSLRAMEDYTIKYYPEFYTRLIQLLRKNINEKDLINYEFSKKSNKDLINSFSLKLLEKDIKINFEYLLARDLTCIGLPFFFEKAIHNLKPIFLLKLPCNYIKESENKKSLEIIEKSDGNTYIEIDEIDEIILFELSKPKFYNDFILSMRNYLEKDISKKDLDVFINMVNTRISFFISRKVVYCYI